MFITNLDKMEKIVDSSQDLSWSGWDVVKHTPSYNAMFSPEGVYKNGGWHKQKIFPITENGWNVPDSIGKRNAQMEG